MKTLLLMAGLTGSGKSSLALALADATGWPVLDKDIFKSTLLLSGLSDEAAAPLAYELMLGAGAHPLLAQNRSVILDSPASSPLTVEKARLLAAKVGARLRAVLCLCDAETRNARLAQRLPMPSQPRVDAVTEDGSSLLQHLPPDTMS